MKGLHEIAVRLAQVAPAVHVPVPCVELNFARIGPFYFVDDVRMKSPSVLWDLAEDDVSKSNTLRSLLEYYTIHCETLYYYTTRTLEYH